MHDVDVGAVLGSTDNRSSWSPATMTLPNLSGKTSDKTQQLLGRQFAFPQNELNIPTLVKDPT